jgi:hypothetical protein
VDLTTVPDEFDSMLLAIKLIQGNVRYDDCIAHSQFGIGDIVFLFLREFGFIEVGVHKLAEVVIDVLYFRLFFSVKP